jgi:hypothetical protein
MLLLLLLLLGKLTIGLHAISQQFYSMQYNIVKSEECQHINNFLLWLKQANYNPLQESSLYLHKNPDNSNSIFTSQSITINNNTAHKLISIPQQLLITVDKIKNSKNYKCLNIDPAVELLDIQLLSLFLIQARRNCYRNNNPNESNINTYISLLPKFYTCLEYWTAEEMKFFNYPNDSDMRHYSQQQTNIIVNQHNQLLRLILKQFPSCGKNCKYFVHENSKNVNSLEQLPLNIHSYEFPSHNDCAVGAEENSAYSCPILLSEYQWAYCTVQTRSCYYPNNANASTKNNSTCCLIPFLDMLNHSDSLVANCEIVNQRYQLLLKPNPANKLHNSVEFRQNNEVFISYGSLDNYTLLTRYGFALSTNCNDTCIFTLAQLEYFLEYNFLEEPFTVASELLTMELLQCSGFYQFSAQYNLFFRARNKYFCHYQQTLAAKEKAKAKLLRIHRAQHVANEEEIGSANDDLNLFTAFLQFSHHILKLTSVQAMQSDIFCNGFALDVLTLIRIRLYSVSFNLSGKSAKDKNECRDTFLFELLNEKWLNHEEQRLVYRFFNCFAKHLLSIRFSCSMSELKEEETNHSPVATAANIYHQSQRQLLRTIIEFTSEII